jgi:hypothetical protein
VDHIPLAHEVLLEELGQLSPDGIQALRHEAWSGVIDT